MEGRQPQLGVIGSIVPATRFPSKGKAPTGEGEEIYASAKPTQILLNVT